MVDDERYANMLQSHQNGNVIRYIDFGNICSNQIAVLEANAERIFEAINAYNAGAHYTEALASIIYITCIDYAIKTRHHKHVNYN